MGNSIRALRGTSNGFIKTRDRILCRDGNRGAPICRYGPGMTKSTRDALPAGLSSISRARDNTDKRSGKSGFGGISFGCSAVPMMPRWQYRGLTMRDGNECAVLVQFNLLNPDLEQ